MSGLILNVRHSNKAFLSQKSTNTSNHKHSQKINGKKSKKCGFISTLRLTVSLLLLFIAIFTLGTKTYTRTQEGKERAQEMRSAYIAEQRRLIKFEVDRVVKIVDYEVDKHLREAQKNAKQRTVEAYTIANHIYAQNKEKKTEKDIQQNIIEAIRPIRFDNGNGSYFINTFNGIPQLMADSPELEGTNMLYARDFTTKQTGNGLGLAMAYSIIERHQGVINAQSQPGTGSTFSILLLADIQPDKAPQVRQSPLRKVEPMEGLKILLIEDDKIVQEVLTSVLKVSGYTTDVACEGKIGVAMYQVALKNDHPYHLVISDLTIPGGMGGREAVQKILDIDSNAKVIATSGYAMDPIMAHFEEYGFKGRIPKPFKLKDVRNEITRVYNCS